MHHARLQELRFGLGGPAIPQGYGQQRGPLGVGVLFCKGD